MIQISRITFFSTSTSTARTAAASEHLTRRAGPGWLPIFLSLIKEVFLSTNRRAHTLICLRPKNSRKAYSSHPLAVGQVKCKNRAVALLAGFQKVEEPPDVEEKQIADLWLLVERGSVLINGSLRPSGDRQKESAARMLFETGRDRLVAREHSKAICTRRFAGWGR